MITLTPHQNLPNTKYSKIKVEFKCECGNLFYTSWSDYQSKKVQTCGKCKLFRFQKNSIIKFNKLELLEPISQITKLTQIALWKCECGTIKSIKLINVINNYTTSCGCSNKSKKNNKKYQEKTKEQWLKEFPELINFNLPENWSQGTNQEFQFKCKCGNLYTRKFNRFSNKSTCGKCNLVNLLTNQKINNFIYIGHHLQINSNSTQKLEFICCKCQKPTLVSLRDIYLGKSTCGKCNIIELTNQKFGKLRIKKPIHISRFSDQKLTWICDCGNESKHTAHAVLNGLTRSCGNCRNKIHSWYLQNQEQLKSLQYPIQPGKILDGIEAKELIKNGDSIFKASCLICKQDYYPKFSNIKQGESLTCGCISNKISLGQKEIAKFIESLNFKIQLEHSEFGYRYDIFVPDKNLIIEYNGLKWHSFPESKKRDLNKYNKANHKYDYIMIYEDEWKFKKDCMKDIIKNRLKSRKPEVKLRPSQCDIQITQIKEADNFFNSIHYIGQCKSKINYGAYYKGTLLACMSFKRPTRKSKYDYELVRMAADPNYQIHGIWSKMLKQFKKDYQSKSIVSFSDNRLFSGEVYQKIGFKFDGNVAPDYAWWKHKRRYHKSGLRKPVGEIKTETEIRMSEGYQKIWDLGKKRWVFNC